MTRSPTELRYKPADNAAAAALWTAADAAAGAAECDDPRILRAVLLAAAATAIALAQTGDSAGTPTRRKAAPDSGGRIPEPGPAETGGPQAHQRQGPPPAVAQPSSLRLAGMTQPPPTAPQGQDEPVRSQEHHPPAVATAPLPPLRSRPAKSRPRLSPTVTRRNTVDRA